MKHSLRRTISVLVPATIVALALAVPASTSAGALQTTSLACDDGTNLNLALDATALNALTKIRPRPEAATRTPTTPSAAVAPRSSFARRTSRRSSR
jgi:hypothetical protein